MMPHRLLFIVQASLFCSAMSDLAFAEPPIEPPIEQALDADRVTQVDEHKTPTAQEQIEAWQAHRAQDLTPARNAFNIIMLTITPPASRDEAHAALANQLRADIDADTNAETPPKAWPYYRSWFEYKHDELEETRKIQLQYEQLRSGKVKPDQVPAVKAWLDAIEPALDKLSAAAQLDDYWYPFDTDQTLLRTFRERHHMGVRAQEIAESFRARAYFALADDDLEQAVRDCITADRLSKLVLQSYDNNALEDAAREARDNNKLLSTLLNSGRLNQAHLIQLAKQWGDAPKGPTSAQVFDQVERLWLIDYFERVASGKEKKPAFLQETLAIGPIGPNDDGSGWAWMLTHALFDTDRATQRINDRYDELVKSLEKPTRFDQAIEVLTVADKAMREHLMKMDYEMIEQVVKNKQVPANITSKQYTDRIVDSLLALLMHPNRVLDGPFDRYAYQAERNVSLVGIALTRWRVDHANDPKPLNKLVPNYLQTLPLDPYTQGQPIQLKYDPNSNTTLLYSLGPDQQDDPAHGDHIVFIITAD